MSTDEDLKSVNLKVFVNCCEGCKRKVSKALRTEGVLKTEIHPTLPKITVTGYVDAQTLIGKLAKRGKKAQLWPKQPEPEKVARAPECVDEKDFEDDKRNVLRSHDANTIDDEVDNEPAIDHQVKCFENPDIVSPIQSHVYYGIYNPCVVPMIYCAANEKADVNANFSVTPWCCHQHQEVPVCYQPAVEARQSTDFADYFNDENTVGCYVM